MKALIFAAGLGTRLKPLTDRMPKALVPVAGKPLLRHLMEKLRAAGITDVVINVHHFADQIEEYVEENNDLGMRVQFSDEREELLETGGGILHAEKLLEGEPFLVHNVDILSNVDLKAFVGLHRDEDVATLLVSERESSRYLLFDEDDHLVGWTNVKTGEVKSPYGTIDPKKYRQLAFAGMHVISPKIFTFMKGWNGRFSIIDFYLSIADKAVIRGVTMEGMRLLDVGKVDSLQEAECFIE